MTQLGAIAAFMRDQKTLIDRYVKKCRVCDEWFYTSNGKRRHCSDQCSGESIRRNRLACCNRNKERYLVARRTA